ncbi:hypothetical protein UCDDS831_g08512 [Diplodia seriata]|uniref:Uncharacterized protein n=1 Tax=Diplodia seriata TaxID=420778 RepID=A0A0G2DTL9_9PEZI|nr:hypothetical protein UCDDS831_g08512 [Diplodia seriata]
MAILCWANKLATVPGGQDPVFSDGGIPEFRGEDYTGQIAWVHMLEWKSKEFPFNPSGAEPINDDSDLYSSNPFSPIVTDESSRLLPAAAASSPALVSSGGISTDDSSPPPQFNKPLPTLPREEEQPQPPISVTPFADDDVFFDAKSPAPDAPLSWLLPADRQSVYGGGDADPTAETYTCSFRRTPMFPCSRNCGSHALRPSARPIIIPVHPRRKRKGETDESYKAAMAEVRATMLIETLVEMRQIAYAIAHPPDTAFLPCKLVHAQRVQPLKDHAPPGTLTLSCVDCPQENYFDVRVSSKQVALLEAHDSFDEDQDCLMVPDGAIARKYPELYAEQMALLEAKHRFDEYRDDLKARVTLGRRELLNLYRVRWMTAHFASRLGRAGVYNTAELDAFTYDPLVDADMQRVMEGVRGMRRKLQILAIRGRCLNTLKFIKLIYTKNTLRIAESDQSDELRSFLDLPGEIRNMIYAYCLEDEIWVDLTPRSAHILKQSSWADALAQVFIEVVRDISKNGPAEHAHFLSYHSSTPAADSEEPVQSASVLARMWIPPTAALNDGNAEDADFLSRASSPPTEAPFDPIEAIAFFNEMCDRYKPAANPSDPLHEQPKAHAIPSTAVSKNRHTAST